MALSGEDRMTDRVDAAVDAMEPASGHPPSGRAGGEPQRAKLRERHDAVLLRGERGEPAVGPRGCGRLRYVVCRLGPDVRDPERIAGRVSPMAPEESRFCGG
jgi:hypothetical protein